MGVFVIFWGQNPHGALFMTISVKEKKIDYHSFSFLGAWWSCRLSSCAASSFSSLLRFPAPYRGNFDSSLFLELWSILLLWLRVTSTLRFRRFLEISLTAPFQLWIVFTLCLARPVSRSGSRVTSYLSPRIHLGGRERRYGERSGAAVCSTALRVNLPVSKLCHISFCFSLSVLFLIHP